jgi:hypothetical protein
MAIYQISIEPFDGSNGSGQITLNLQAGVAVLTDFEQEAVWLDSAQVIQLFFTKAHTAQIDDAQPVGNSLTVAELKSICRQLDLSTSGLKFELLARVQEATGD